MKGAEDDPGQAPGEQQRETRRPAGGTGAWSWEIALEGRGRACSDRETGIGFCNKEGLGERGWPILRVV